MADYTQGELVRVTAAFVDNDGVTAVDPAVVAVMYKPPSGVVTTLVYDTDAEVVKDAVGSYHVDIDADEPGIWNYYWYSETTYQAADKGSFTVTRTGVETT